MDWSLSQELILGANAFGCPLAESNDADFLQEKETDTRFSRPVTVLLVVLLFLLDIPLPLLHQLRRAVFDELAIVVDTIPLGLPVRDIDDATVVEHVATETTAPKMCQQILSHAYVL